MNLLTGANAALRCSGTKVAKCIRFDLDIAQDTLETTKVSDWDRTYTRGRRGTTGQATIIYDTSDSTTINLLNQIFGSTEQAVEFCFSTREQKSLSYQAIVTNVGVPAAARELTICEVSFQITGTHTGAF